MDNFEDYDNNKAFWFLTYLLWAEIVSKHPQYSAKNYDIKDDLTDFLDATYKGRKRYGENDKVKSRMGVW